MNERIDKLLVKAGAYFGGEGVVYDAFDPKKFAELIVLECVSLIRKQSIGEEILGGQRYKTVQLGETIATITEYFGVEE